MPSSPAFNNQPDKGKTLGFDFYRDPLNSKKPMQTFEEIMKMDVADRSGVMRTQRELLMRRYNLTPQLRPALKKYGGRKLRQKSLGQIEFDVKPLQPGKHIDLHLRENLASGRLLRVGQCRIRKNILAPYLRGRHARQLFPA